MDSLDIVSSTADAVFASDEKGHLVVWNKACEELLGFRAKRVLGKPCHKIISGQDSYGNRFCNGACAIRNMIRRGEPVRTFGLRALSASGRRLPVHITVVAVKSDKPSDSTIFHIVHPSNDRADLNRLIHRICDSRLSTISNSQEKPKQMEKLDELTPREREVLHLMAGGAKNREITKSLSVSDSTVRNHIQHILRKLEVHSKLEAVSLVYGNHKR